MLPAADAIGYSAHAMNERSKARQGRLSFMPTGILNCRKRSDISIREGLSMLRRQLLHLAAGAAALPAISRFAWAQAYPTKPVRWIVGFTPAGGNDIVARLMGRWLSERLGQPFVIENRPGAGTNIATEAVVNAPPDGYTLLLANMANAINATLYEKLSFNFMRDIAPVAGISSAPLIMAVNPSVPART